VDFRDYWDDTRVRIEEELAEWTPRFFRDLPPQQVDHIRQLLQDGKRLRGCLTCLVNRALGGRIEDAIPRAIAIECIQAASLIHDDYVDGDTVRRNHPAQWTIEGPRKAVLLGDVVFATVIQRMAEIGCSDGMAAAEAIATVAQGAYLEFLEPADLARAIADGRYRRNHYERVIHLKTGALFGAAARLGALSARAGPELCDLAFRYGARIGEAYQIADDLHDLLHPDGRITDATQLALLFLHFTDGIDAWRRDGFRSWCDAARPVLQERMMEAVRTRVGLAVSEAARFPDNAHAPLLHTAPAEIVRMMESTAI